MPYLRSPPEEPLLPWKDTTLEARRTSIQLRFEKFLRQPDYADLRAYCKENVMSEMNKTIVRRIFENFTAVSWPALFDELYKDCVYSSPAFGELKGEALKNTLLSFIAAFPDARWTVEEQIAEGNKVVTRWSVVATHKGEFMGLAPTGKRITCTGIIVDHLVNGKIVRESEEFDALGLLRQLGIVSETKIAEPVAA